MKIDIVSSAISSLIAAYLLQYRVDTLFIIFNKKTYPIFCKLVSNVSVDFRVMDMSFRVKNCYSHLEYIGS